MPEFDDVQVLGDFNVQGMTDLGQTNTGAFSLGPGYLTFAGAPVETRQGILLSGRPTAASSEGPIVFYESSSNQIKVLRPNNTEVLLLQL